MSRLALLAITAAAPNAFGPALAATHTVAAGDRAQERLQEALILAQPGDEVVLGEGRFTLDDGLSLDVDNVTVRGAGMNATVLDFTAQKGAGEGLLVTSDTVTLRDFAVENPHGDGIKSKGADGIVYQRIRVTWTGGPKETNGAYGLYPVESTGVLIAECEVSGASDAGIYVGQSKGITVRNSVARHNVAGIEIENSRDALVEANYVTGNTGGILVFDLPSLPVMGGGNTVVRNNLVAHNTTPNFAPKGNIVAGVRRGTGIMVMANDGVLVEGNTILDNPTAPIMVVAYPMTFDDKTYNPYPRNVTIGANRVDAGGTDPQIDGKEQLLAAFARAAEPKAPDDAVVTSVAFPATLSEYGFFTDAANQVPAARVMPYRLNTPLFSDGAEKLRFVYLPSGTQAKADGDNLLKLPVGSALIKTFAFEESGKRRLIETRVMLHRADGWVALPYLWNAEQTEARLALAGARVAVITPAGEPIEYRVPNKNQCKECHGLEGAVVPIGPKARNLSPEWLEHFAAAGMLDIAPAVAHPLPMWEDRAAIAADAAARSYLDVNCAHCHQPGATASNSGLDLRWEQADGQALGIMKRPVAAGRGAGDWLFDIVPGKPAESILVHRMGSLEGGVAMPELGKATVDREGLAVVERWIAGL